jgi:hypothetical protein
MAKAPTKNTKTEAPKDTQSKEVSSKEPKEIGGPKGLEPTRFGDWERAGKCVDF